MLAFAKENPDEWTDAVAEYEDTVNKVATPRKRKTAAPASRLGGTQQISKDETQYSSFTT